MGYDDYRRDQDLIFQKIDDDKKIAEYHAKIAEHHAKIAEEKQLFADLERLGMKPKCIRTILRTDLVGTPAGNRKIALDRLRERLETLKRAPSKT